MITLNVQCERSDYFPGNDVRLDVQIRKGGASPLEIQDPQDPANGEIEYLVVGPSWPAGAKLSQRSAAAKSGATRADQQAFPPVKIEADSTWETRVSLSALADLSAMGEYRVRVRLARPGADPVESREEVFRVGPLRERAVHLAVGVSATRGQGEGVLLERGELHTFEFSESAPEIAEADVRNLIHRASVGQATDVAIPARNTPFFDELIRWVVWLDDAAVKALTSVDTTPASVTLPTQAACLVKPPLKTKGGPVEVLVLLRDRKSMALARFEQVATPGPDSVRQAAGALAWTTPLPAEARVITAALGPVQLGSERHVAFAANTTHGIEIFHARYGATGLTGPLARRPIEGRPSRSASGRVELAEEPKASVVLVGEAVEPGHTLRLLEGATAGLHVDERGEAWASFLVIAGQRTLWIEARFPSGAPAPPQLRACDLAPLDGVAPTDGAVLYVGDPTSKILRREVLLGFEGNRLARWNGSALVPVPAHGKVAKPLLMVAGQKVTYLLQTDEAHGPHLEPLP